MVVKAGRQAGRQASQPPCMLLMFLLLLVVEVDGSWEMQDGKMMRDGTGCTIVPCRAICDLIHTGCTKL